MIGAGGRAKNVPKLSSKCMMDRICKIKQYLNYINWWHKSKCSSSPEDILKSREKKREREKLYTKETSSKAAATVFLSKIPNRKKISNEDFNLCEKET